VTSPAFDSAAPVDATRVAEAEHSAVASRAGVAAFVWFAVLPVALAFAADEPVAPAGLAAFPDAHYLDVRSGSAAAAPESGPDG
jgi:hypothetical protein